LKALPEAPYVFETEITPLAKLAVDGPPDC
jgi:hypothetical protein